MKVVITVHADQASADRMVAMYKADYERIPEWRWSDRSKTWLSHDDGPTIGVQEVEVRQ